MTSAKAPHISPEPSKAASLIIIDRSQTEPRLLFGRRHADHVFMPGFLVFPGGRYEPEDAAMRFASALPDAVAAKLSHALNGEIAPEALALTAIRETFEETGLLIGKRMDAPIAAPAASTSWTRFAGAGVWPDLSALSYVARAVTPPGFRRRYDTHFFAVDAAEIAGSVDGHVHAQAEFVELLWATWPQMDALGLAPVTQRIVAELALRLSAGLGHDLPVPYFTVQDDCWTRAEF